MTAAETRQYVLDVVEARAPGEAAGKAAAAAPLRGWVQITPKYLEERKPRPDLGQFFDGVAPDWKDIRHPGLKPRRAVADIVERYSNADLTDRNTVTVILGASGEGKSTILMQAVKDLALREQFDAVYWRSFSHAPLTDNVIEELGKNFSTVLIAADDAESLLTDIVRLSQQSFEDTGLHLHLLLASRDTDWVAEQDNLGWKLSLERQLGGSLFLTPRVELGDLTPVDARIVVDNWWACSSERPSRLGQASPAGLTQSLLRASEASHGKQALLGGLLELRYDNARLRDRLAKLLQLAASKSPEGSPFTLADLLVVLAAIDVSSLPGLPRDLAAEFMCISEGDLRSAVEVPLKRELVFGNSSRLLFARHPRVSRALLELALGEQSTLRVAGAVDGLLESLQVLVSRHGRRPGLGKLIDIGRRLMQMSGLGNELVGELALHATRKACALFPRSLGDRVAVSQTLRTLSDPEAALAEVWSVTAPRLDERNFWADYGDHVRSAWAEFASALGSARRRSSSFWAARVSLSDLYSAPITDKQIALSLNLLALNAKQEYEIDPRPQLAELVAEIDTIVGPVDKPFYLKQDYLSTYMWELGLAPREFGGSDKLAGLILETAQLFPRDDSEGFEWVDALRKSRNVSHKALMSLLTRRLVRDR